MVRERIRFYVQANAVVKIERNCAQDPQSRHP